MSRTRKPEASIRPVAELFARGAVRLNCRRCRKVAAIIERGTPLCGACFLEESLRRLQS